MFSATAAPAQASQSRLAEFLELADAPAPDLAEVVEYYLGVPLRLDLTKLEPAVAGEAARWQPGGALGRQSLNDVFSHPRPPLGLLQAIQSFAKAHFVHPLSLWGEEIALLVYYTAIAAALVRHGVRISRLSPAQLEQGFDWALAQAWVGGTPRRLLAVARDCATAEAR